MASKTHKPSEILTSTEVDSVIATLLYRATPEMRTALMAECPVAYVKLHGFHPTVKAIVLAEVAKAIDAAEGES